MDRPTECKYCGCGEIRSETDSAIHFRCFSSYWHDGDEWNIATNCAAKCAVQLVELRGRIQRAIEVLDGAERYDVESCEDSVSFDYHDHGQQADAEVLDRTLEILRGEVPESPDSAPVTTDDLAMSDYYEAVRQRVPWMVSVEHIEGLIEGYRQCGVPVWQAAEHIQRIYGGGYGKAN